MSRKFSKALEYVFINYKEIDYSIIDKNNIIWRACVANDINTIKILVKYGFNFASHQYLNMKYYDNSLNIMIFLQTKKS